jgi:urea transport system substrate-binding protein
MASVLVVDDDPDILEVLLAVIVAEGHEVSSARNGREALERVAAGMPDLILLDIKMPVMDGKEFAARFRQAYARGARIVVMTAAESAANRAREVGADDWLSKPFDLDDLVRILHQTPGG